MANPQKESGYTAIANELLEAFALHKFTEYQRSVVLVIWRKTYGFGKKEDWIANSQFVLATGIRKEHISHTLLALTALNVVARTGNKLSVNKDWESWKVACRRNGSCVDMQQKLRVQALQKKKETNTKERVPASREAVGIKNKKMPKKNSFKYSETQSSDTFEDVIDSDSGAARAPTESPKGEMRDLIVWGEGKISGQFANMGKQTKSISTMLKSGYAPDAIRSCWERLEKDKFWKSSGIDFGVVLSQISKKVEIRKVWNKVLQ